MNNKHNKLKFLGKLSIFIGFLILAGAGLLVFLIFKEDPKNYFAMGMTVMMSLFVFSFYLVQMGMINLFLDIEDSTKMTKMNSKNSNKLEKDILEVLESLDFLAIRRNKNTRELLEEIEGFLGDIKRGAIRIGGSSKSNTSKANTSTETTVENNAEVDNEPGVYEIYDDEDYGTIQVNETVAAPKEEENDERAIKFLDPNLESIVREKINKPEGNLYPEDVEDINTLSLSNKNIVSIEGIQNLLGLQKLDLWKSEVDDISPLAALENLVYLRISKTNVVDISPLEDLISLEELYLQETDIEDISVLANLESLMYLYLEKTKVKDITPLENLKNLEDLYLWNTPNLDTNANSPVYKTIKKLEANGCNVIY